MKKFKESKIGEWLELKQLLYKFSYLGVEETTGTGAIIIGKAPFWGGYAWLNTIHPPITSKEIEEIEVSTNKKIPASYANFLTKYSNGIKVLFTTFSLFGYRYDYIRDLNHARQPFDIIFLNECQKPSNSTADMFFIGSYDWDGSFLYMTPDEKVHFCSKQDATSLCSWDSFETMLISEIKRLYTLYDSNGKPINPKTPETPVDIKKLKEC